MRYFLTALQFLTILSLKRVDPPPCEKDLRDSMALFPLVGCVLGGVLISMDYILRDVLPGSVATVFVLATHILLTGALHVDGFTDTIDGIAGGGTPQERLRIMRDSHTGAVGTAMLILLLLTKFLTMDAISGEWRWRVFFLFPVVGRWAMVVMASGAGYARRDGGLGRAFAGNAGWVLSVATGVGGLVVVLILGLKGLFMMAMVGIVAYIFTRFFISKLGGVTGDVFGFQCETAELFFLILFLILYRV